MKSRGEEKLRRFLFTFKVLLWIFVWLWEKSSPLSEINYFFGETNHLQPANWENSDHKEANNGTLKKNK